MQEIAEAVRCGDQTRFVGKRGGEGIEVLVDLCWSTGARFMERRSRGCRTVWKEDVGSDAVRGELGWWRMRARRDLARLRFWGEVGADE